MEEGAEVQQAPQENKIIPFPLEKVTRSEEHTSELQSQR